MWQNQILNIPEKYKATSIPDLQRIAGEPVRVITYPEIHRYRSIRQLLDGHDAIIILYNTSSAFGHWVALFRSDPDDPHRSAPNEINFFDSYGYIVDDELSWPSREFREENDMDRPYLSTLLLNHVESGGVLNCNDRTFQRLTDKFGDIATCGRWSAMRVRFRDLTEPQWDFFIDNMAKKLGLTDDLDGLITVMSLAIED